MPTLETPAAPPAAKKKPAVEYVDYDQYIDRQVRRTRQAVKLVDLSQMLLLLVTCLLAFLLTATVIEHWVLSDGFSSWGRTALFMLLVGGVGYFVVWHIWPLVVQPINPTYAAQAIEREHPTLKNSLINFLLFRSHPGEMPPAVFDALEEQAAQRLSRTTVEGSVDRGPLIRLGYLLLAITVAAVIYSIISPKSSLSTAARVLMPWAHIAPPSRVRIEKIEPGNVEVVQGESIEVAAQVSGLRPGEEVRLEHETVVGLRAGDPVTMLPVNDSGKFACRLPAASDSFSSGIGEDLRYRITAGDGHSIDYIITVLTAPAIRVRRVHYDFPEYTGYVDRHVENRGDIHAIEGTKVTLFAKANGDIESAHLDLASDGRLDKRMRVDGNSAQVGVKLEIEGDRKTSKNTTYQLRFTSTTGLANQQPTQHSIEVIPDYAPEVELIKPAKRVTEVELNETVELRVNARDPDFALAQVHLAFEKNDGSKVLDHPLLTARHQGQFDGRWKFTPADHDLQPGDVLEVWAEATDIRAPQANRAISTRKELRIIGGEAASAADEGQGEGEDKGEGTNEGKGESGEDASEGEEGNENNNQEGGERKPSDDSNESNETSESDEASESNEANESGEASESNETNQTGDNSQTGAHGESDSGQNKSESQQDTGEGGESASNEQQDSGAGGENENRKPVANDGSDDATAFEKMQRKLNEQEREQATRREATPQEDAQGGDPQENQSGEPNPDRGGDPAQSPTSKSGQSQENKAKPGDASEGEPQPREAEGTGAETKAGNPREDAEHGAKPPQGQPESASGEQRTDKGEGGAGEEASPEDAPDNQREQKPRDKQAESGERESSEESNEPPTPSHSKHESDSQGDESGDRSGGGEEGGGQDAPRDGTGSAGQHEPADEGSGQSNDTGPGETGERGGDMEQSDEPTGNPGEEAGEGSTSRPGDQGSEEQASGGRKPPGNANNASQEPGAGEEASPPSTGGENGEGSPSSAQQQQEPSDRDMNQNQPPQNLPADASGGPAGGEAATDQNTPREVDGAVEGADEANLEYAREQTKLVLDQLEDQLDKNQVDQEMLDELGWSKEDLRKFVDRWNRLRADAAKPGADAAQQELDARLKSLGESLRPTTGRTLREQDNFRDLREGYHDKVPLKYRDRLKAYTEGVSKPRE